ncbi:MAG: O-antigen ligase family protein [Myxococcota bacterium]
MNWSHRKWLTCWTGFSAIFAFFMIGSVHLDVQLAIIASVFISGIWIAIFQWLRHKQVSLVFPFFLFILTSLWVIFQAVPLPLHWLEFLSPHLYNLLDRTGHQSKHPLSYEPAATILEAAKIFSYGIFFLVVWHISRRRNYHRLLIQFVAYSGVFLALTALIHHYFSLNAIYGFYVPQKSESFLVPFVNSNHAGGFYTFIFFLLAGLGFSEKKDRLRNLTLFSLFFPFLVVIHSGSRGALLALSTGLFIFFSFYYRQNRKKLSFSFIVVIYVLLAASVPLMDFYVLPFTQSKSTLDQDMKIRLWKDNLDLGKDHLATGVGKGSFRSVIPHYINPEVGVMPSYAENVILQQIVDLGLFFSFFLLLSLVLFIFYFFRRVKIDTYKLGLVLAALALFIQNIFDFNLEFPGTALPLFLVVGVLSAQKGKKKIHRRFRVHPLVFLGGLVLVFLPLLWGVFTKSRPFELEKERSVAVKLVNSNNFLKLESYTAKAVKRHPSDYFLATLRGISLMHVEGGKPLKWIGLASWLFPGHYYPELAAARILRVWGRNNQAKIQYRRALSKRAPLNWELIKEIRSIEPDSAALTQIVPPNRWISLKRLLPGDERYHVCKRIVFELGIDQDCFHYLGSYYLQKNEYDNLWYLASFWDLINFKFNPVSRAYKLRHYWENKKFDIFEKELQKIARKRNTGVFKGLYLLWIARRYSLESACKAGEKMIEPSMPLSQKIFIYRALAKLYSASENKALDAKMTARKLQRLKNIKTSRSSHRVLNALKPLWKGKIAEKKTD